MKTFIAIIALSLTLNLVSGQLFEAGDRKSHNREDEDEDEDEDKPLMDISETRKCYVYGQCQEYSLNFKVTKDPEGCHKFCSKDKECTWWSWEPAHELCMIYANCTEEGVDPPAVEPCPDCISGEAKCPARECHGAFKCQADFVDSFAIATLEECIEKCNEIEDCKWFTLEKANDHCILYEGCNDQFDCETCATGEKKCAHGYKGTTPAPPKVVKVKTVALKLPVQKVKTVALKLPVQKVTTVKRPVQTVTTVKRPVQTVTTVKRPVKVTTVKRKVTTVKRKPTVTMVSVKPKQTGPPWCVWRGETSGKWVCDVDWSRPYGYENLLEKIQDLGWEWTAKDCDELPTQQMMQCMQEFEMYQDPNLIG